MRTFIRSAALFLILLVAPARHSVALPDCNYSQLHCNWTCRYQQDWGGACSPASSSGASYCWQELAQNEGGSYWPSCHEGGYDACCDELSPG